jgi:hypothetical protein
MGEGTREGGVNTGIFNNHVREVCPFCLSPQAFVFTAGHYQCSECRQVIHTCCEGEGDPSS